MTAVKQLDRPIFSIDAADIPAVSRHEAMAVAQEEYRRLLNLLESLNGRDWAQPTYCTAWDVKALTAHLAGAVAGYSSISAFLHQSVKNPYLRDSAEPIDGINKLQVEERAGNTTVELVNEFRHCGPQAVKNRFRLPWLLRQIPLPLPPVGRKTVGYLMDVIYPRDQWMHRYDISAATGREMVVSEEHDGRILDLVLRDIAHKLQNGLRGRCIELILTGSIHREYRLGEKPQPDCMVTLDVFAFHLLASGRIPPEDAQERAGVSGDQSAAAWFLQNLEVVY